MLAWLSVWDKVQICIWPLPLTISCSSKSRLVYLPGFTFLVQAYLGSPGQNTESHKTVVVVVVVAVAVVVVRQKSMDFNPVFSVRFKNK